MRGTRTTKVAQVDAFYLHNQHLVGYFCKLNLFGKPSPQNINEQVVKLMVPHINYTTKYRHRNKLAYCQLMISPKILHNLHSSQSPCRTRETYCLQRSRHDDVTFPHFFKVQHCITHSFDWQPIPLTYHSYCKKSGQTQHCEGIYLQWGSVAIRFYQICPANWILE